MTTSPQQGITVYTTTGNTYAVTSGASWNVNGIAPTGELAVSVFAPAGNEADPGLLASFGSVEAVYVSGTVAVTAQSAAPRGGL
jgi:hypothetical protein